MSLVRNTAFIATAALALAGCQRNPLVVKRSACPAVAIPTYTGDVTLFRPGKAQDANNIDLVATITNVRDTCVESAAALATGARFDVVARRSDAVGARSVSLPVFATLVQGGNLIVSKQQFQVTLNFADGQTRTTSHAGARSSVASSEASLPAETQALINRKRKTGDVDAAVDPLSDPAVRAAIRAHSFELLLGFQLGEAALAYNVTK